MVERLKRALAGALALTAVTLGGCATTAAPEPAAAPAPAAADNDPLEGFNRAMFEVNLALDKVILRPVAIVYRTVIPGFARDRVRNVLDTAAAPVTLANDILQGEIDRAGNTVVRFGINATFGIAGLFDVATDWGHPAHEEDFGQTLAVWGVGEGPYLFLPLLGPAPPRDLLGRIVDIAFDPLTYVEWGDRYEWVPWTIRGVDIVDIRSRNIETLDEVERTSLDFYATVRSAYRQNRAAEIRNQAPDVENLPDFDAE